MSFVPHAPFIELCIGSVYVIVHSDYIEEYHTRPLFLYLASCAFRELQTDEKERWKGGREKTAMITCLRRRRR